ncbi:MAG: hypothetical protein L3J74_04480 [Bacteroidales bacterium]|nr:hypothetical protein [Bacteroidales bacterium]
MKRSFVFIFFFVLIFSCKENTNIKNDNNQIIENALSFKLGDSLIIFKIYSSGTGNIIYFNLHDDENTAVEAAENILNKITGKLIEIKASGERLISFNIDTSVYKFDPNRIFTPAGRKATLERYSKYTQQADSVVEKFALYITDTLLQNAGIIVALHNNTADNYSILSYAQGGKYASDAAQVHINPQLDPDNFFYVTQDDFYEKISKKGYNVLLQDNSKVTDDGSLSVYCGTKGIKYINIEAQKGHTQQQKAMILAIQDIISTKTVD